MIKIIDIGIPNNDNYIKNWTYSYFARFIVSFALKCQYYASIASQGIGTKIRTALFEHINKLSIVKSIILRSTLITRLTNDITLIQMALQC